MSKINQTKINRSKRTRPQILRGKTYKIKTGCGNLYITINIDENGLPFEIFIQMGHSGGCRAVSMEAIGRLCSLALRISEDPEEIIHQLIDQLKDLKCPSPMLEDGEQNYSCMDAVSRVMNTLLNEDLGNGK